MGDVKNMVNVVVVGQEQKIMDGVEEIIHIVITNKMIIDHYHKLYYKLKIFIINF